MSDFYFRRHGLQLMAALMVCPLLSCMEVESVVCPSGLICGPGLRCAVTQDICIETPCGDGLIQEGEACDDGNVIDNDGCNSTCTSDETCGNGVEDPHEVCDDRNTQSGDACSADCLSMEVCGNGYLDVAKGEKCDDGNTKSGDNCSADCRSTEFCGNDYQDVAKGEKCDDGNTESGDGCSADCRSTESCGNGYLDVATGEKCDDSNTQSGDGCSADCRSTEFCGNGYQDLATGETCDDGNTKSDDGCSADCRSTEICGNGYIDAVKGEKCDNGNTLDGDGCSANCRSNETCGNGYTDFSVGEQCDDGNTTSGDGCSPDCKTAGIECGNGQLDPGEQCDDGDTINENECLNTTCVWARCGDGVAATEATNVAIKEECDDMGESLHCDLDCTLAYCGDRVVNSVRGEECDTGGESGETRTCTKHCYISRCGDGYVNTAANERCDDRNADRCGTCSSTCSRPIDATQAHGSIQACNGSELRDGETFVLDDGVRSISFEFTSDGTDQDQETTKYIVRRASDSAQDVAAAIKDKINELNDLQLLDIRAFEAPEDDRKVKLLHLLKTSLGNQRIVESVRSISFVVEGMSGGMAGDCPRDMGCVSSADCAPGLSCNTSGVCQ
ncbi:DUF4215 domain-containing protein [Hyalangium minutum]|uniref:Arsenical pump-driving ATPase n=1 Tax=Hyalangium minutum TaxID=394096 RepID=A0A085WC32_9BACT|nr:DUF4215 domain-containing protein [Hyalangium minutum]KFE65245.1 Arsenical pump-driving ATPase [Hyalangium minutum]